MNKHGKWFISGVMVLVGALLIPAAGYSKEITVDFGETRSVTVINATAKGTTGNELKLVGQLSRPHKVLLAGHLHAYAYTSHGEKVSDSKHRVSGLKSKKGGVMRVPFRISIANTTGEIDRVYLEYHSAGHSEI